MASGDADPGTRKTGKTGATGTPVHTDSQSDTSSSAYRSRTTDPARPRAALPPSYRPPRVRLVLSWLSLFWERFWSHFWPVMSVLMGIAALALSGLAHRLPGWVHGVLLAGLTLVVLWTIWRCSRHFVLPPIARSWRQLEDSRPDLHRPLTAVRDSLTQGQDDPLTRALWKRHRRAMSAAAQTLEPRLPRPNVAAQDPQAVRFVPVLFLTIALIAAGPQSGQRLWHFVTPNVLPPPSPVAVSLWITPPDYTGQTPLHITAEWPAPSTPVPPVQAASGQDASLSTPTGSAAANPLPPSVSEGADGTPPGGGVGAVADGPLTVPAGTTILTLVHGDLDHAELTLSTTGSPAVSLDQVGALDHQVETTLTDSGVLSVIVDSRVILEKPVTVAPDMPPTAAFESDPDGDDRGRLRLKALFDDDFGVTKATATIAAADSMPGPPQDPILIPFSLGGSAPGSGPMAAQVSQDLADHLWAGRQVSVTLHANDALGQTGRSADIIVTLPERLFSHPVAQALSTIRKGLTDEPHTVREAVYALDRLTIDKAALDHNLTVYLSVRAIMSHLIGAGSDFDLMHMRAMLWAAALELEEGSMVLANRDLQRMQEQLERALQGDMTSEEMERLIEETRRVLSEFMNRMADMMPPMDGPNPFADMMQDMNVADLDAMLQQLQELTQMGAEEAARELLSQLSEMMRAMAEMRANPQMAEQMRQSREFMNALADMRRQQQQLLDETFRESNEQRQAAREAARDANRQQNQNGSSGSESNRNSMERFEELLRERMEQARRSLEEQMANGQQSQGQQDQGNQGQNSAPGQQNQAGQPSPQRGSTPGQSGQAGMGSGAGSEAGRGDGRIPDMEELTARQQALTSAMQSLLGDIGEMTGSIPQSLSDAALAMDRAAQALGAGQMGLAMEEQNRALESLSQGRQQAAASLMSMMGQGGMPIMMPGVQPGQAGRPGQGRDPLGRSQNGGTNTEDVGVPDEVDMQRAHEILEELRRRVNDPDRTPSEKDYLRRLIPRF